jgi:iron complex outermembrane recepter protein
MLKGTLALPGDHQLNLEYTAASTKVATNIAPVPEAALAMWPTKYVNGVNTGIANPYYPSGADPTFVAPGSTNPPGQIRVRYRTIPAGPRADENNTFQQRFVASLEGTVAGWDYNTGISYNTVKTTDDLTGGYVNDDAIVEAVASGKLNPFSNVADLTSTGQLGQVQDAVARGRLFTAKGTVVAWEGRLSRELGDWFSSGRKAGLAVGAEIRHEKYEQLANVDYASQVVSSTGFDPNTDNEGKRSVWAVYSELNVPVSKALEVTGSIRYDKYPDFGSTVNPKLSAKFAPSDKWALRGAVATGFRAPSLFEEHSAQTFTNTANNWDDPRNSHIDPTTHKCVANAGFAQSDVCATQYMSLTGGNPKLTPEKSKQASFGIVLQPLPELDATIDFWWVQLKNSIGALSDATVFGDPTAYASHFVRAPNGSLATDGRQCNTVASPGPECGYVLLLNDNLGGVKTNGVDLAVNYRLRTGMGNWAFHLQETYTNKFEYQTEANGPWFQGVGQYSGTPTISGGGPIFRNQFTLGANWAMGPWGVGVVNHYKSGYLDQDIGQAVIGEVGSYSTWDLYGTWAPNKQLMVTVGVKNVFDKSPPQSVQSATFQVGYDPRFTDPFLRSYYIRGTYKF